MGNKYSQPSLGGRIEIYRLHSGNSSNRTLAPTGPGSRVTRDDGGGLCTSSHIPPPSLLLKCTQPTTTISRIPGSGRGPSIHPQSMTLQNIRTPELPNLAWGLASRCPSPGWRGVGGWL